MNLIGEHTDYNDGLCLPFAIEQGITVRATPGEGDRIEAEALDLGRRAGFALGAGAEPGGAEPGAAEPGGADSWSLFIRGAVAELQRAGIELRPCRLEISADLAREAGLSSSAALCVATCLALCAISGQEAPERVELARLCSRVENDWTGAQTGLLDQLAVLFGEADQAVLIDMRGPRLTPVPLQLDGHLLAVLDSGSSRNLAESGYNQRRVECRAACRALGIESLRDATGTVGLPEPLDRRVRHVLTENERVGAAVAALERRDPAELGRLLDASHRSLRDDYEVSSPAVERAIDACKQAGALGARIMGGGFGGSVLALFAPDAALPEGAAVVAPGPPARLLVW